MNDLDIPTLKLAFPTTQDEIIELIDKTNRFLRNLDSYSELSTDLKPKIDKYPIFELKKILDNLK